MKATPATRRTATHRCNYACKRILPYDPLHLDRRFPQSKSLRRKTGTIACSNGVICAFRFTVIISIVVS